MYNHCRYQAADAAAQDTVPFLPLRQQLSNHIAWSYRDCYTLDCTAFASRRFSHVHMRRRIGSAAEKCWLSSCCTGGTNIPLLRSAVSTMRHCASKEQYDSRVNGKEYTLIASAKLEI